MSGGWMENVLRVVETMGGAAVAGVAIARTADPVIGDALEARGLTVYRSPFLTKPGEAYVFRRAVLGSWWPT